MVEKNTQIVTCCMKIIIRKQPKNKSKTDYSERLRVVKLKFGRIQADLKIK